MDQTLATIVPIRHMVPRRMRRPQVRMQPTTTETSVGPPNTAPQTQAMEGKRGAPKSGTAPRAEAMRRAAPTIGVPEGMIPLISDATDMMFLLVGNLVDCFTSC